MGMYDTINDEQVKCFPWVSLYYGKPSYHGGDLRYYGTGNEVPWKKPHYNYGKNFIIFDLNKFVNSSYCPYDYILHVIVDGKVKDTFENEIGDIDWSINENVISYYGEFINIKSSEDVCNYIKEQREHWKKYEEINKHWNELFQESIQYFHGLGLLAKDSEEKKIRKQKIEEIHILMDKEKKRTEPKWNALAKAFSAKWGVDTYKIDDLIELGEYISSAEIEEDRKVCEEKIRELLSSDDTLYERYVEWQGSDEFIKEYKIDA